MLFYPDYAKVGKNSESKKEASVGRTQYIFINIFILN